MGSIAGTILSGFGVATTAFHGEDVTRWPSGIEADAMIIEDAIWTIAEERDEGSINPQQTYSGTLSIVSACAVTDKDIWVVNGLTYKVSTICDVDPVTARRELLLVRAERSITRNVGGAITLVRGIR